MIETAVVIANWNGKKYLKDCFDSLAEQTYRNFKIFFVDNGSEDGSVDFIRVNYPQTEITILKENTGFAKGYNFGIEKALNDGNTRYIVILNNDTKLEKECIGELVGCAKKHPDAGSIQPKVLNFFGKNKIDSTGIIFSFDGVVKNRGYGEVIDGQYDIEEEIFGANGTAALISKKCLENTKIAKSEYFDNSFFAYYEDADLAWRMRLAGFTSYYCPAAVVHHVHSATAGKIPGFKAYYLNRNRFFMLIKNYPPCRLAAILFILTPIRYILLFFRVIMRKGRKGAEFSGEGKMSVAKEILRAWGSVVADLPSLASKRFDVQKQKKVRGREVRKWFRKYGVEWSKTF